VNRESMPIGQDTPERMDGMVPGVKANGFLFLSAIRGRDANGDTPEDPFMQARHNVESVLAASGATLKHVVKVTLYLHDLDRRAEFHKAWLEFFPTDPPARIAVGIADANAVKGGKAHYALDVIALAP
jgi:2-iminobutanoate/2-iminopropanoate deaminase